MRGKAGFTLIELSIVLVIIGLIVAGVVGGQSLVRQAQLRSVISEQDAVKVAINNFRLNYRNSLPGDFSTASQYWTGCAGGGASLPNCNGNGDGQINLTNLVATDEAFRFWEHLNLAGLYPGSFTGAGAGTTFLQADLGSNVPSSKFSGAGIFVHTNTTLDENHIIFGAPRALDISNGDVFSVTQAASLDDKVDDGNPGSGIMRADGQAVSANCIATATTYNLANQTGVPCFVWFIF